MAKHNALGKGVGALIKTANPITEKNASQHPKHSSKYEVIDIEVDQIAVNPLQPRIEFDATALKDLKDSFQRFGLLNPITVKETTGGYELVAGERRFRACKLAELKVIPAIVTSVNSDVEQLEKAIIENVQRENLNPMELALSYKQLMQEFEYTQEKLAERLGQERATIANVVRLLNLPEQVQNLVATKQITLGHSKVILALEDKAQMIAVANDIIAKGLSVRATETLVRDIMSEKIMLNKGKGNKKKTSATSQIVPLTEEQLSIENYKRQLREKLSTNIEIYNKRKGGIIEISFSDNEQFERILEALLN
jgi:ParB family chromosome partitioning protein